MRLAYIIIIDYIQNCALSRAMLPKSQAHFPIMNYDYVNFTALHLRYLQFKADKFVFSKLLNAKRPIPNT
jgi:hypothetical protein